MQLTNTTDYAIRIVCYLASENKVITTAELSRELNIPASYIPKITKQLKEKEIVKAAEGSNGGYMLEKRPEEISLMDVINCTESTMAISRCLEKDGYCSRNYSDCCKVHKVLLDLQNTYNNRLENVKISDIIQPGKDEYFGCFYVVIKLNLKDQTYESGKSWCVANILEKASKLKYTNIIVFDMHGEYKSLTEGTDAIAQSFKIAGPGDLETSNDDALFLPYWLLNREELLSMILDRSDSNAPNQASRFTLHIRSLKEATLTREGKTDTLKTFTVDSPIPFLMTDLLELLKDDDTRKGMGKNGPIKGEWEGKLTRFISRLETKIADKTYGFMFQPTDEIQMYNWLANLACRLLGYQSGQKGIKIIDFSEVPSDVLPVVTGTLARLLYDIQFWMNEQKRTPFTLVCDEAHLYLPIKEDADAVQKQALYNFERIAKEGRKYGVSILAVSQRPADVSKTILSQCNNFVVLRLTNERDKGVIKNLLPDSLKSTIEFLPLLDVGEALVVGDAILLPSNYK